MTFRDVGDVMKEIELTQGKVALVDDIDYEYLMQWKWYANRHRDHFRARRTDRTNGDQKTIRMHNVIAERMEIDSEHIDHIDRNPLNNQRSNLRVATRSQNQHNRGAQKNSKTGVKGISFDKTQGRYQARIEITGKHYYIGRFDTVEEAAVVIKQKREELVGEFACS